MTRIWGPARADGARRNALVFFVLAAGFMAAASLAAVAKMPALAVAWGGLGLGLATWAASSAWLARKRRRGDAGDEPTAGNVQWTSSPLTPRASVAAGLVILLTVAGGVAVVGIGESLKSLLAAAVIGVRALIAPLREPVVDIAFTLDARKVHIDFEGTWIEVDWSCVQGAEDAAMGTTLDIWIAGEPQPISFPAGNLPIHPAHVARVINHLVDHPRDHERLSLAVVREILQGPERLGQAARHADR